PVSRLKHSPGSRIGRGSRSSIGEAALGQLRKLFVSTGNVSTEPKPDHTLSSEPDWPVLPGYEILGVLGRGGMGVVFKARHLRLHRLVALKMVRAGADNKPESYSRFLAEGEAIARLQHANVVQIYDVGF